MKTILLDTPHRGFAELKLVHRRNVEHRKYLFITFEYGDMVEGKWVAGDLRPEEKLVKNIDQILDGKGGEIRAADPQYDVLIEGGNPKVTFTSKEGNKRWKKVTRPHPVHGNLDLWVQTSDVASIANIYQYAIDNEDPEWDMFAGSVQ